MPGGQFINLSGKGQILAKLGPASRFVIEANIKAVMFKSNSRRSKEILLSRYIRGNWVTSKYDLSPCE